MALSFLYRLVRRVVELLRIHRIRWSAQDYTPVDGVPFVGRLLPRSRVLVATGFTSGG